MKFLSMFVAILVTFNAYEAGKLTWKENQERLATCGKPPPGENGNFRSIIDLSKIVDQRTDQPWLWLYFEDPNFGSTATMISRRHFLVSAFTVLDEEMKWRVDGSVFEEECSHNNGPAEVPSSKLRNYTFRSQSRDSERLYETLQVVKAYILKACKTDIKQNFPNRFSLMIVEVEAGPPTSDFPCIADSEVEVNHGDDVDVYSRDSSTYRTCKISRLENSRLVCDHQTVAFKQGSPVIKNDGLKRTIVGVSTSNLSTETDQTVNKMFNIQWFEDDICNLIGVCSTKKSGDEPTSEATTTPFLTFGLSHSSSISSRTTSESSETLTPSKPEDILLKTRRFTEQELLFYMYRPLGKRVEPEGDLKVEGSTSVGISVGSGIWALVCSLILSLLWS